MVDIFCCIRIIFECGKVKAMEKLIFISAKKNSKRQQNIHPTIRVSECIYQRICEISKETAMPIREVSDRLLSFALAQSEVAEE